MSNDNNMTPSQVFKQVITTLLKKPIGTYSSCRGGFGSSYHKLSFVKTGKNKVSCIDSSTWNSMPQTNRIEHPTATFTKDGFTLHNCIQGKYGKGMNRGNAGASYTYPGIHWHLGTLLSIGGFESDALKCFNIKINFKIFGALVTCNNGVWTPQKDMQFDWDCNFINPTKLTRKLTKQFAEDVRNRTNTLSRARYRQAKAEREFKAHREAGTLVDWDIKKVLSIKNAQVRQQAVEEYGITEVLAPYPTVVKDKDVVDGRPYELLEITLPDTFIKTNQWGSNMSTGGEVWYLKMTNPSTGEYHLEGIARAEDNSWDYCPDSTVRAALAWRDGEVNRSHGLDKDMTWKYTKPEVLT